MQSSWRRSPLQPTKETFDETLHFFAVVLCRAKRAYRKLVELAGAVRTPAYRGIALFTTHRPLANEKRLEPYPSLARTTREE
jgi:hypothetical protein